MKKILAFLLAVSVPEYCCEVSFWMAERINFAYQHPKAKR